MKERNITCIVCPRGCALTVSFSEDGSVSGVVGNLCPRGKDYAINECTHPTRTVTSTVKLAEGGIVSVKTSSPIPKELIFEVMKEINRVRPEGEVKIGDVIIANVLDTGADVVATSSAVR